MVIVGIQKATCVQLSELFVAGNVLSRLQQALLTSVVAYRLDYSNQTVTTF